MNTKKLLADVRRECKAHDIKLYLGKGRFIKYGKMKVNGLFDIDTEIPKLSVATGQKNWQLILSHEFSHFQQWVDKCEWWKAYETCDTWIIDNAVSGKRVNEKELVKSAKIIMMMERDCEMRSHKLLKSLGYPKEKLCQYVQKANAYYMFYMYIAKHKKWYTIGKEPYNIQSLWKQFPMTFDFDIEKEFKDLEYLYDICVK